MSSRQRPGGPRADRAQEIGLFRYALIREAADPQLSPRERGVLVRALAAGEHAGPFGTRVQVSRVTLDRWIRAWRAGGFDALVPPPRGAKPRTPAATLELAVDHRSIVAGQRLVLLRCRSRARTIPTCTAGVDCCWKPMADLRGCPFGALAGVGCLRFFVGLPLDYGPAGPLAGGGRC